MRSKQGNKKINNVTKIIDIYYCQIKYKIEREREREI